MKNQLRSRIAVALSFTPLAILVGCGGGSDAQAPFGGGSVQTPLGTVCTNLSSSVTASKFPVQSTSITLSQFNAAGTTSASGVPLPDHCLIQGIAGAFTGNDGVAYGTGFEMRLPLVWNGRFMFQGGGGNEGSVPAATGTAGTLSPTVAQGWAVISQDGGHSNAALTKAGKSSLAFLSEPRAFNEWATGSIDKATQTAKFLIQTFYGKSPDRSYAVGCSTGGRQGMVFSQQFANHFDGIVAGDPIFDQTALAMTTTNSLQAIAAMVPKDISGNALFYQSFTTTDDNLFTSALLEACDGLDGAVDGIVDNLPACTFDPATFVFKATGQALQCTGAKADTCLSSAQVVAIKQINRGPTTSAGVAVVVPSGTKTVGYPYDGGFMFPTTGQPVRVVGTSTTQPGNISQGGNYGYYVVPQDPNLVPYKTWNFDTTPATLDPNNPIPAISKDLSAYKSRGGKIIFYNGASDPGQSMQYTVNYFNSIASLNGTSQDLAKLYLVPNMGHCSGGPAPDQFDFLTPLVAWVEQGKAPNTVVASGKAFTTAPTTRTHPLCAYPKTAKYTGPAGGDIGDASNFTCQ